MPVRIEENNIYGGNDMNYRKLAKEIRTGYDKLKKDSIYKFYHVTWNDRLETSEITIKNDAGFKAIIIGDTRNRPDARGYMYLFYTDSRGVPFPSITEIERRLSIVAKKEILRGDDVSYYDWKEYGSLKLQREYFAEIIIKAARRCLHD